MLPLSSRRVLITSGPTQAPIDAVRYIANTSSGATGCALAAAMLDAGAKVVFVRGQGSLEPAPHPRLRVVPVRTIDDLVAALECELGAGRFDAVIHAMAVLDYVPAESTAEKVPSGRAEWTLRLVPTPKVIDQIRELAPDAVLVGFKLVVDAPEDALREAALALLARSGADLVVANDLSCVSPDHHAATLLLPSGEILAYAFTKEQIASELTRWLATLLR